MINYAGFDKQAKKSNGSNQDVKVPRFKSPYEFHYEDYTGETVSEQFFPSSERMKQFLIKAFVVLVALIVMRISAVIQ